MSNSNPEEQNESRNIVPWKIAFLMFIAAYLLPFQFLIYSDWRMYIVSAAYYFPGIPLFSFYSANEFISTLPFNLLRFVFAIQIGRYYKYMTTRTKTIAVGIIAEIPSIIVSFLYLLVPLLTYYPLTIAVPLPTTLVLAWILIRRFPQPPYLLTWKGEKKILDWWPEIDEPQKDWN